MKRVLMGLLVCLSLMGCTMSQRKGITEAATEKALVFLKKEMSKVGEMVKSNFTEQAEIAKANGDSSSYTLYTVLAALAGVGGKKVWDRDPKGEEKK